jgi:hypothetical protein
MRLLPEDFLSYHARDGRREGQVSAIALGWMRLWALADIYRLNDEYHVAEFAPDLFGIGSDGAAEMLAFDKHDRILKVPFIGMDIREAILIAPSWQHFERIISA